MGDDSAALSDRRIKEQYHSLLMWMSIAITATIFAVGNILFGHFEEKTPKWKRVAKVALVLGFVAAISYAFGPVWGLAPVAVMLIAAGVVHLWWLPRHGINGLTGEPRDKYYEFRGWKNSRNE